MSTTPAVSDLNLVPSASLPRVKTPHEMAKENEQSAQPNEQTVRDAEEALKYIEDGLKRKGKLDLTSQKEFIRQAAHLTSTDYTLLSKKMAERLGISKSEFNKAVDAARPRVQQMEGSSTEDKSDSILSRFNDRYFVVENYGGKCHVCWIETDEKLCRSIGHQSFEEFRHRFQHKLLTVSVKTPTGSTTLVEKSEANVWLDHRDRRQFEKIVFKPEEKTPENIYNLWQVFAYEPKQGDCSLYLAHVRDNVCRGNNTHYEWLMNWMSFAVQNPNEQGHSSIVVFGEKGVGKNVWAETFSKLWGAHGLIVNDQKRVVGNFNAHLRDKCALVCDEAFFAGDPRQDRVLKSLITGSTITIEPKGVDAVVVPNLLRVIILGNDRQLVRATWDERRYFVLECGNAQRDDQSYFGPLTEQLEKDGGAGYSALLYELMHRDLTGFNVRKPPHTEALHEQMAESTEGAMDILREMLSCGQIPGTAKNDGTMIVNLNQVLGWAIKKRSEWSRVKYNALRDVFGTRGLGLEPQRITTRSDRKLRVWILPRLFDCRQRFVEKFRFRDKWQDDADHWESTCSLASEWDGGAGEPSQED